MITELGFRTSAAPEASPEDVARLVQTLREAKTSLSAAELAVKFYGKDTETAKRRIRAIACAARPRVVSFPGSDGYDLWARCKQGEILHAIDAMQAMGRAYFTEAQVLTKAYHAQYRGEPGDDGQGELL